MTTDTEPISSAAGAAGAPALDGIQHVGITVTDIEASEEWYARVLGLQRRFVEPHHGGDGTGYAVVLGADGLGMNLGLDKHASTDAHPFDPAVTGLDHLCFQVSTGALLDEWIAHLDRQGVAHSGITPIDAMDMRFGVVNFCDPDGIALELIAVL